MANSRRSSAIRIAIAEDDPLGAKHLMAQLARYQDEHDHRFIITGFRDGADLVRDYRPAWDVLLLDIEMPRVDGMTAARRIREIDREVIIVFVTGSPQFAINGYEVGALSYLLKPVTYSALELEIGRCLLQLYRRERRHLIVTTTDGSMYRIDTADILYLESDKHKVVVHTFAENLTTVAALKKMEAELVEDGFFRCNNGLLVNLRHATGIVGNECRIRSGERLPISRPRKKDFLAALADYIGVRGVSGRGPEYVD